MDVEDSDPKGVSGREEAPSEEGVTLREETIEGEEEVGKAMGKRGEDEPTVEEEDDEGDTERIPTEEKDEEAEAEEDEDEKKSEASDGEDMNEGSGSKSCKQETPGCSKSVKLFEAL